MKLSLKIPLAVTYVVVLTGIVIFVSRGIRGKPFSTSSLIIWLVASVILAGISLWSWLRSGKK